MDVKTIPAFYCCYLLRSTVRKASNYIGSTPHPTRRLGQHNGKVKGGAVRTSRASLQPWEMACIVAGFPSNIAALQFEWAWHNPHLTRHIASDQRISFPTARVKTSKTGKTRRKPGRPRSSMMDKISNLHLLLRAPYFSRWPLEVRFFSEDVYRSWLSWCQRVDDVVRIGIPIVLDLPQHETEEEFTSAQPPIKKRKADLIGKGGIEGVDPTYARFQDVLEKSKFLLDQGDEQMCGVCSQQLNLDKELFIICPDSACRGMSHITCLSRRFLENSPPSIIVPEDGHCPSCTRPLIWAELMREVSLRARGAKEVQKLLGKKRGSKAATAAEILETEDEDEDDVGADEELVKDILEEEDIGSDTEDAASTITTASVISRKGRSEQKTSTGSHAADARLDMVIEDSDDER